MSLFDVIGAAGSSVPRIEERRALLRVVACGSAGSGISALTAALGPSCLSSSGTLRASDLGQKHYTPDTIAVASQADLAVMLVDARTGVDTQTRRDTYLFSRLGIERLVLAVNKMDLVGYRRRSSSESHETTSSSRTACATPRSPASLSALWTAATSPRYPRRRPGTRGPRSRNT